MSAERWLPVPGWEERYAVSDHGRVMSLGRWEVTRTGVRFPVRQRILSGNVVPDGHVRVGLTKNRVVTHAWVHRLVLMAFVGPCPEGMVTCHNDGDPANNHLTNLRWDTVSENARDVVRHGINPWANKTECLRGHAYTEENTYRSKKGHRSCLTCRREAWTRHNAARSLSAKAAS